MKPKTKAVSGIIIVIFLFVFFSYLIQTKEELIKSKIGDSYFGMVVYVLFFILSIVFAPVSASPFIPFGVGLWGISIAVFLSVIGWTTGAVVAFFIARKYGIPIVKKLVSMEDVYKVEKLIPEKNLFFIVLLLRMIIPFDGLSYAVGLFTKMRFWPYFFATLFGLIPITIILVYFGKLDYRIQIIGFVIIGVVVLLGVLMRREKTKIKLSKTFSV